MGIKFLPRQKFQVIKRTFNRQRVDVKPPEGISQKREWDVSVALRRLKRGSSGIKPFSWGIWVDKGGPVGSV